MAGHSDGMAFDSAHKRIYVPGAEGYIAAYQQKDADHYELVAKVPTAPWSKDLPAGAGVEAPLRCGLARRREVRRSRFSL
ncbi:MAG TPA: hypothetical protein VM912_17865 [Terriglobales bacterium]|nr:hypothetical protein [Terriglobales bacterium]